MVKIIVIFLSVLISCSCGLIAPFSDLPDDSQTDTETENDLIVTDYMDIDFNITEHLEVEPPIDNRVVGESCNYDTECGGVPGTSRLCLKEFTGCTTAVFPGGYCSAVCTSDSECGDNAKCAHLATFGKHCLKECTDNSHCRGEYHCGTGTGSSGKFCIIGAIDMCEFWYGDPF